MTDAAVDPKISARRALLSKPTTIANKQVKSTIIPILIPMLEFEVNVKQTMAPIKSTALRMTDIIAPAR